MILFCEDCGEKNDLDPAAAFTGGKAVFQCCVCGYPNAYAINSYETIPSEDKAGFFQDIQSSPGVIGAFFYHKKQGVLGQKMPPVLTPKGLERLGAGLVTSYVQGYSACRDLVKMDVMISDKYFSVFKLDSQLYVVVVASVPGLPGKIFDRISDLKKKDS